MDRAPWKPERSLDPERAAKALRGMLPAAERALGEGEVREVGRGWDNVVIRVGALYLRCATRRAADVGVRREQRVLPTLSDLGVPVPQPVAMGEATEDLPGPWMAYRPLAGQELCQRLADGQDDLDPAPLGLALRALHTTARAEAATHLPVDPSHRSDPESLARRVHEWLAQAVPLGAPAEAVLATLRRTDLGPVDGPVVLVHGDLHLRHVLVDARGHVTGLIDWGDVHRAVAVADLGILWCMTLPQRARFLEAYGPVVSATLAAARRFAMFSCLALWVAAARQGQGRTAEGARQGLLRALVD